MSKVNLGDRIAKIARIGALLSVAAIMTVGTSALADQRRGGGGGGGGSHGGGGGNRGGGGGGNRGGGGDHSQGQRQPAPVHAQREPVRTNNFVPESNFRGNSGPAPSRPARYQTPNRGPAGGDRARGLPNSPQVIAQRRFTKTPQGRVYDNGLRLRAGNHNILSWQRPFFPHGYVHYPYYRQNYLSGACFISPFGFYFGVCLPFIDVSHCNVYPPSVAFVDVPNYNGNDCTGYAFGDDDNFFNHPDLDDAEPGLANAVDDISETFQSGNIDSLISLINPNMSISIYLRGKYKYSLASNDYVDMTRDALQSLQTQQFNLTMLHQRSPNVFAASGTNTYVNKQGQTRTVYVSFVLQDISGMWTLTQVDSSPDHVQKW